MLISTMTQLNPTDVDNLSIMGKTYLCGLTPTPRRAGKNILLCGSNTERALVDVNFLEINIDAASTSGDRKRFVLVIWKKKLRLLK